LAWSKQWTIPLERRGPNELDGDLQFEGLARPKGNEVIRLRFFRIGDIKLDIPLSAETLADLAHVLGPLRGIEPDSLIHEIADLEKKGLRILE
jgi:hypothetical protein